jgi:hypothetical protein
MRRFFLIVLFILFLVPWRQVMAGTIPDEIKKTVAFVFVKGGDGKLVPNGTAFFVGVPNETDPQQSFVYLVTARHVLRQDPRNLNSPLFPSIFLRLDRKGSGTETVELPLREQSLRRTVFSPDDRTVDLAAIPCLPDPNIFDFKMIPLDLITSSEKFSELGIAEGSEIFFVGLFLQHLGEQSNCPIVRFGRVALLTTDRIDWSGIKMELYLVESASYGGNSGSPVFYFLGADRKAGSLTLGPPEIRLAGVMMGAFQTPEQIRVAQTSVVPYSVSNIGIAAVVPSFKLYELLLSDALKNSRQVNLNAKPQR